MAGRSRGVNNSRSRRERSAVNKRRRDSMCPSGPEGRHAPSPGPPRKVRCSDIDLGDILQPVNIPTNKYYAIQNLINHQDQTIRGSKAEAEKYSNKIRQLEADLRRAKDEVAYKSGIADKLQGQLSDTRVSLAITTKDLQDKLRALERNHDRSTDLLQLGQKALAAKNKQNATLTTANKELHATIGERDATISSLQDHANELIATIVERDATVSSLHARITQIAKASGEELVNKALEAQANHTLSMVQSLQAEVAEGKARAQEWQHEHRMLLAAYGNLEHEKQESENKVEELMASLKSMTKKMNDCKQLNAQQTKLMEDFMDAQLQVLDYGREEL